MSFWSKALSWGITAAGSDAAKQTEVKAVQAGMAFISGLLKEKAPDFYEPVIAPLLAQVSSHAIAAIMSKAK